MYANMVDEPRHAAAHKEASKVLPMGDASSTQDDFSASFFQSTGE